MNELITIKGIRGRLNANGDPELNLEDVAKGLGIVKRDNKKGVIYERLHKPNLQKWLFSFGLIKSEKDDLPEFVAENIFYKLCFKASNETATTFQDLVTDEVLPTIRKTGGYVANEDLFVNTYLPFADDITKELFKSTLTVVRNQNHIIQNQQKEILHKENVIIGLVDDISLAEKRQILNRVVKKTTNGNYAERYTELYKQFELKYHCNLNRRFESEKNDYKPKIKNKMDYIDRVMKKIPELYEIAAKLYENDVKALVNELYELNNDI